MEKYKVLDVFVQKDDKCKVGWSWMHSIHKKLQHNNNITH